MSIEAQSCVAGSDIHFVLAIWTTWVTWPIPPICTVCTNYNNLSSHLMIPVGSSSLYDETRRVHFCFDAC